MLHPLPYSELAPLFGRLSWLAGFRRLILLHRILFGLYKTGDGVLFQGLNTKQCTVSRQHSALATNPPAAAAPPDHVHHCLPVFHTLTRRALVLCYLCFCSSVPRCVILSCPSLLLLLARTRTQVVGCRRAMAHGDDSER